MCSTDVLDLYEEYRQDFEAWGHEFLKAPLSLERFGDLVAEREDIEILDDCGHATEKDLLVMFLGSWVPKRSLFVRCGQRPAASGAAGPARVSRA